MSEIKVQKVAIASLQSDPANARKHDKKNLEAIKGSLERFGQVRPIIVWGDVIIAGNGTTEAAKELGWSEITVSKVPTKWTYEEARAYALADNRTAELATWDADLLADQLVELDSVGWDMSALGFPELQPPTDPEPDTGMKDLGEKFEVVIECSDEDEQAALLLRLSAEGLKVRAIVL